LLTELIAGRLAELADAGPSASTIRVDKQSLPSDGSLSFEGVIVGSCNHDGAVNDGDLTLMG
jgi:hypothetical protein